MRPALALFALTTVGLVACTHPTGSTGDSPPPSAATESTEAPAAPSQAGGRPLATVVTKDARVTILSTGSEDLRFVVRKTDGSMVADGITSDELQKTDPILHSIVTSAVAGTDKAGNGGTKAKAPYVDATLHLRAEPGDHARR
jgi:hypothetical protein